MKWDEIKEKVGSNNSYYFYMKLIEFSKTECGVDFLMKVGPKNELKGNISDVAPPDFVTQKTRIL